ncbi:MAG: glutaredoxin family protein [candidate division NC10 bacterium]|nr:glutaredoxin family protein [candidate division NC10 bacterium]
MANGQGKGHSIKADLYTKEDCCLCQEMKEVLERVKIDYPLELVEVDIQNDPGLFERYRDEIPVLFLEWRKAFKYRVKEKVLRRKLDLILISRTLFG